MIDDEGPPAPALPAAPAPRAVEVDAIIPPGEELPGDGRRVPLLRGELDPFSLGCGLALAAAAALAAALLAPPSSPPPPPRPRRKEPRP